MQARRASRELALILFSQLDKIAKYQGKDFSSIILQSARTLISSSSEEVSKVVSDLNEIKNQIIEYENNHENNLKRPIDLENIPVPVKLTSDFQQMVDTMLSGAEKTLNALDIAELCTLSSFDEVKEHVILIANEYKKHSEEIDKIISEFSFGWDFERIYKIDRDILRIVIVELLYIKSVPQKVAIDEGLELAKKYSTDDSASFINGILARVMEHYV